MTAVGKLANHLIAFERRRGDRRLLVVVPRLSHALGVWPIAEAWSETFLLAAGKDTEDWEDVLSRRTISLTQDRLALPTIFMDLPFAVLYHRRKSED